MTIFCGVRALEPDGVDEHVEQDRHGEDGGREPVDREAPSAAPRRHAEPDAEVAAPTWRSMRPARQRRGWRCAASSRRDRASYHLVEGARRAGAERDAQDRGEAEDRARVCRGPASRPHRPVNTTSVMTARLGQRDEVAPFGRRVPVSQILRENVRRRP